MFSFWVDESRILHNHVLGGKSSSIKVTRLALDSSHLPLHPSYFPPKSYFQHLVKNALLGQAEITWGWQTPDVKHIHRRARLCGLDMVRE